MTKKDFQLIADVIKSLGFNTISEETERWTREGVADAFAKALKEINPRALASPSP